MAREAAQMRLDVFESSLNVRVLERCGWLEPQEAYFRDGHFTDISVDAKRCCEAVKKCWCCKMKKSQVHSSIYKVVGRWFGINYDGC